MNTTVVYATSGDKLKIEIDALGATTVMAVVKVKNGDYLVIWS